MLFQRGIYNSVILWTEEPPIFESESCRGKDHILGGARSLTSLETPVAAGAQACPHLQSAHAARRTSGIPAPSRLAPASLQASQVLAPAPLPPGRRGNKGSKAHSRQQCPLRIWALLPVRSITTSFLVSLSLGLGHPLRQKSCLLSPNSFGDGGPASWAFPP